MNINMICNLIDIILILIVNIIYVIVVISFAFSVVTDTRFSNQIQILDTNLRCVDLDTNILRHCVGIYLDTWLILFRYILKENRIEKIVSYCISCVNDILYILLDI